MKIPVIVLACAMALALTACIAVPVSTKVWDEADRAPKAGDLVRVETHGGKRVVMRVYRLDEDGFAGVTDSQYRYRVPYSIVKTLEVRKTETEWIPVRLPIGYVHTGSGSFSLPAR
jgi:hypothetical protein